MVNPLNVELCAVLERALNYMHTGNTKVIATSIMKPLWIGEALIQDGLPCLNPNIIRFFGSSSWEVSAEKWPSHRLNGIPNSAAKAVIEYNYGDTIYNVSGLFTADQTIANGGPSIRAFCFFHTRQSIVVDWRASFMSVRFLSNPPVDRCRLAGLRRDTCRRCCFANYPLILIIEWRSFSVYRAYQCYMKLTMSLLALSWTLGHVRRPSASQVEHNNWTQRYRLGG